MVDPGTSVVTSPSQRGLVDLTAFHQNLLSHTAAGIGGYSAHICSFSGSVDTLSKTMLLGYLQ